MPKIVDHDARRRELIAATWDVIAAQGLEGVTMRRIAAAAGCTTGRITHYFANREALILAALRESNAATSARIVAARATEPDPVQRLIRVLEETLPLDRRRLKEYKVWLAFWSAGTTDTTLAKENDTRHIEWRDVLVPLIADVAPRADARYEAELLMGLVDGLGLRVAVHPTKTNREMVRATLAAHVRALAHR